LGRWAAGPLGRWAAGPLGQVSISPTVELCKQFVFPKALGVHFLFALFYGVFQIVPGATAGCRGADGLAESRLIS
ncbi:MAG: hypothetical protein WD492_05110, partial [Alkalispirochaeta sp.]